jgi:subtilisin family serine protease
MYLRSLILLAAALALPALAAPVAPARSATGKVVVLPLITNNSPSIKPDDNFYQSDQWNLQVLDLPHAWFFTTGSPDVTVAVIDTGVDVDHPELLGRVAAGRAFLSANSCDTQTLPYDDDDGHGTHVAGIVAARGNNASGIAGIAWESRILPVKVLSCTGNGTVADVVDGIYWAVDQGAQVINLSLGWPCTSDESLVQRALDYADERGVVVVAAAGNYAAQTVQGVRNPLVCPAALDHVISVGATTITGAVASYSTHNAFVDVAAPGGSSGSSTSRILSSFPPDVIDIMTGKTGSFYSRINGTSQAAPHVAGLAALLLAHNPRLSPQDVLAVLASTATDYGAKGRDQYFGYGQIHAAAALGAADNPPVLAEAREQARPQGLLPAPASYEPGVVLLRWRADAPADARAALLARLGAREDGQRAPSDLLVLRVAEGSEAQALETLQQSVLVEAASLNLIVQRVG